MNPNPLQGHLRISVPQGVTHHITLRSSPGVSDKPAATKLRRPQLLETGF